MTLAALVGNFMGNLKARAALAAVMCGILAVPSTAQAQSSVGTTLVDVAPEDTFYQMLASLGDELGCFDGTIKLDGRRTLTRFEFAAILNSCVDNLSRRISTSDFAISDADQLTIGTLQQEFASELTVLGTRGLGLSTEEQAASDARANDFSSNRRNVRISVEPFATSVDVATINGNGRREFAGQVSIQFVWDTQWRFWHHLWTEDSSRGGRLASQCSTFRFDKRWS